MKKWKNEKHTKAEPQPPIQVKQSCFWACEAWITFFCCNARANILVCMFDFVVLSELIFFYEKGRIKNKNSLICVYEFFFRIESRDSQRDKNKKNKRDDECLVWTRFPAHTFVLTWHASKVSKPREIFVWRVVVVSRTFGYKFDEKRFFLTKSRRRRCCKKKTSKTKPYSRER